MELRMSWDLALALGANLPRNVGEHRAMLRDGRHILVRMAGSAAGLPAFWELQAGLILKSS